MKQGSFVCLSTPDENRTHIYGLGNRRSIR